MNQLSLPLITALNSAGEEKISSQKNQKTFSGIGDTGTVIYHIDSPVSVGMCVDEMLLWKLDVLAPLVCV